jgi:hypothetical protein
MGGSSYGTLRVPSFRAECNFGSQAHGYFFWHISERCYGGPISYFTLRSSKTCTMYSETRAKILFGYFLCYLANKSSITQIETLNPITIASAHSCL